MRDVISIMMVRFFNVITANEKFKNLEAAKSRKGYRFYELFYENLIYINLVAIY